MLAITTKNGRPVKAAKMSTAYFRRNYGYISFGNKKLVSGNDIKMLIFNVISKGISDDDFFETLSRPDKFQYFGGVSFDIGASIEKAENMFENGYFRACPYSTPHCERFCYDYLAQSGYHRKSMLPSRIRNFLFSLSPVFVPVMIEYIEYLLETPSFKKAKKVFFRFHEGGEMYNQEYTDKIMTIAAHFKDNKKIRFYTYTKSFPFLYKYEKAGGGHTYDDYITVNGSLWDDSPAEFIEYVRRQKMPFYTVVSAADMAAFRETFKALKIVICKCTDCGHCAACAAHCGKVVEQH